MQLIITTPIVISLVRVEPTTHGGPTWFLPVTESDRWNLETACGIAGMTMITARRCLEVKALGLSLRIS